MGRKVGRRTGQAVAAPHVLNRNGATQVELGTAAADLRPALEALGHQVQESELQSGLAIVRFVDGRMIGAADPRRDARALGE